MFFMLLGIHCLTSGDGHHLVDVVNRASATEVVHRASNTLKDRTEGNSAAKTLNKLICYVTNFKARYNEHICTASDV